MFTGPNINKLNGGLGGGETSDRVAVIVIGAAAIGTTFLQRKAYELAVIEDLEDRGVTEETDSTNKELNWYHLSEVFRLSPETKCHVIAVPKTTKVSDLKNDEDFVTALRSIESINTIAVVGLTADTSIQVDVQGAQLLTERLAEDYVYIDSVLIEGKGSYLTAALIADYSSLREFDCELVTPIWAQDPSIASAQTEYAGYAAVGTALGSLLVRSVHESLGSVDIESKPSVRKSESSYSLSDSDTGRWLSAALSNGKSFESLSGANQKKLSELGYVYIGRFEGYAGYYWSDSHTCTASDSDYCYIERNAVWNKAARLIRTTMIPRIRGKVEADSSTGYIKNTTITYWDGLIRAALETLVSAKDIADFDIYINPSQAAVSSKPFNIRVKLVADGITHDFDIDLGYTKSI